jgi:hypothetical protein
MLAVVLAEGGADDVFVVDRGTGMGTGTEALCSGAGIGMAVASCSLGACSIVGAAVGTLPDPAVVVSDWADGSIKVAGGGGFGVTVTLVVTGACKADP